MPEPITIFLADDNLIVREGVRALLEAEPDLTVVGVARDYEELIDGFERTGPSVLVTDIRMPPSFRDEGIEAAKRVRKIAPGTGIVVLSQYDDPEYAIALLAEGADGYAYLLKDRIAEGDQLVRAVRQVAIGGSTLDPSIVDGLVRPLSSGDLVPAEERLLDLVAQGRSIAGIAALLKTTPAAAAKAVEDLFLKLAGIASRGGAAALRRLRLLHESIVEREEAGVSLSRFLPGGIAERLRAGTHGVGETERVVVTVLMSDVRGYTTIAEAADPSVLCAQLSEHRAAMTSAIGEAGGTVMSFIGDAVMGVFGAPLPNERHAQSAVEAARSMHDAQLGINTNWKRRKLPPFRLGIGVSTGEVAAALLGSDERLEYTVIGDTVNLAQRLQQWAGPGETVISEPTFDTLAAPINVHRLEPAAVKGRVTKVAAYRIAAD